MSNADSLFGKSSSFRIAEQLQFPQTSGDDFMAMGCFSDVIGGAPTLRKAPGFRRI